MIKTLRPPVPSSALTAGLAASLSAVPFFGAYAQQAPVPAANEELPTVTVEDEGAPVNSLEASTGLSRVPGTIQDTPQTITVISQQTLQQQGVTTLEQALRNVPGVTASSGEGNGGQTGDMFRIRGFDAKGDLYVDGLRDFGVYTRDSFAFESVEVFKGSSSETFGMGTTGGAINITQKQAHLGDKYDFEGQLGMGPLYRAVADVNKQINDTTAVRLVGMYTEQDIVDRDALYNDRWGFLASAGFGLGTTENLIVNVFYQNGERKPDMGTPFAQRTGGALAIPVTEFGASRSAFYGKVTDIDDYDVTMFTAKYKNEVNDWLTISNDTRVGYYNRYLLTTATICAATTCGNAVANGNLNVPYGFSAGGGVGYDQTTYGAQNITTAVMEFNTGAWRHQMVAGADFYFQHDERDGTSNPSKIAGTIADPNFYNQPGFNVITSGLNLKQTEASNSAVFLSDRIWFVDTLSLLAGARWDNYNVDYMSSTTGPNGYTSQTSHTGFLSPNVSLIWEPTQEQSYYVSWSKSFSPPGAFVASAPNPVNGAQPDLDPEDNETWEIGGKISLLNGKLGLTGALFRTNKSNAYYTDPVTGDAVETGDEQRVQGVELGATGNITDAWTLQAAYTYMDSEITDSTTAANIGNEVNFVPRNSASLWTTYDLTKHWLTTLDGELLVGGGISYNDGYFANTANDAWVPSSFSLDALVSYKVGNYRVAVNAYNLTDEVNYVAAFNTRAVLAPGRSVVLTVGATF